MKHKYCCQNSIQSCLSHMVPIPEYYKVSSKCLLNCSEIEFRYGFKTLSEIISLIYEDMINSPDSYGLPLVEDIEYGQFNPKANASYNSGNRLINLLNNISKAGELVEDCLVVSKEQLNILNKALKSKEKIQNAKMIVGNLKNFGFEIEGYNDKKAECFTISFPDNKFVIYAIKGFLQYDKLPNHIYSLHYYFATDEDILNSDRYSQIFSQYLDGEEKKFFDCFDQRLREESFSCRSNTGHGFTIEYRINKEDDSYLVRCYSENRKLSIVLRLRKFEKYLGAVNNFSSEVKTLFSATTCKNCNEKCNHRFTWEFDGSKYSACVYSNFTLTNYDKSAFENIDEYVKLLCLEREF